MGYHFSHVSHVHLLTEATSLRQHTSICSRVFPNNMQRVIQIKLECLTLCQEELAVTLSNQIRKHLEMYN